MKSISKLSSVIFFAALMCVCLTPLFGPEISIWFGSAIVVANFLPMPVGVLGLNNTNNIAARAAYEQAIKMFFRAWYPSFMQDPRYGGDPEKAKKACMDYVMSLKLSQSEIRLEVELNATSTNFKFGLTQTQPNSTGVVFNTENRLTMQDSLCCNEYGIYVGQPSSREDTTWSLRTYPNIVDFAAGDVAALNETFYSHGAFRITCNNDVIMPYRGLFNHLNRPQTQQTAALGANSPQDQIVGAEDGQITDEPNIVLIGSKGYIPEIILPAALASAAAYLRCVVIFRGILAQNSTSVS